MSGLIAVKSSSAMASRSTVMKLVAWVSRNSLSRLSTAVACAVSILHSASELTVMAFRTDPEIVNSITSRPAGTSMTVDATKEV